MNRAAPFVPRSASLGSGQVTYRPDRPIIHFGSPPEAVAEAELSARLDQAGFTTSKELPR